MSAHISNARSRAARYSLAGTWSRRRWNRLLIPSWAERKRWAWPGDLNRFICRSRRRVGWCEFSARLLRCYGVAATGWHDRRRKQPTERPMERPMPQPNDLSRSPIALNQDGTLIAVIEMSRSSWLVTGVIPGLDRHPLKKLEPDEEGLLRLLRRAQDEATRAGRTISRMAVAFEAGRDGFWLARWLRARGIEAYVIHPTSVAVSREHRRAKTDRLDTALLK